MRTFFFTFQLAGFLIVFNQGLLFSQTDSRHYSAAFKAIKPFRIFLPSDYGLSQKRYGVVYFLHGNFGTHEFVLDGVDQLVNEHGAILVALNGRSIPSDRRPYNVGDHEDVRYLVQYKDYILEVIRHIDSTYRTLPDRAHRALMGHSMGGFMSFVLAGKYPHLFGTAVNMKGAPEFFIGYPDHHTLYSLRYMFKNLHGVHLRFHNSTIDELVNLNKEVHYGALRDKALSYTYAIYPGGHDYTPREFAEAFTFAVSKFNTPLPRPLRWHHADTYSDFDVWDYRVSSNLREPGFIVLDGVTKGGMSVSTRKWEPDGPLIGDVRIDIATAPIYQPNTAYSIFDFNQTRNTKQLSVMGSDAQGKISLSLDNEVHHIGIFRKNDAADIAVVEHRVGEQGVFLDHNKAVQLKLRLLNKGGRASGKIRVTLSTSTEGVSIHNPALEGDNIPSGEVVWFPSAFTVTASNNPTADGSPFMIRFNIRIVDDKENTWHDEFDAPVFYDVPAFTKIGIDDWDKSPLGVGNGNMIPEPGETIMIYQGSHRTRLYFDDPYVTHVHLHDELTPDKWGGDGFALSSLIKISKDCPPGRKIKFLASYEEKEWKTIKRNITWGTFVLTIGQEPEYK